MPIASNPVLRNSAVKPADPAQISIVKRELNPLAMVFPSDTGIAAEGVEFTGNELIVGAGSGKCRLGERDLHQAGI